MGPSEERSGRGGLLCLRSRASWALEAAGRPRSFPKMRTGRLVAQLALGAGEGRTRGRACRGEACCTGAWTPAVEGPGGLPARDFGRAGNWVGNGGSPHPNSTQYRQRASLRPMSSLRGRPQPEAAAVERPVRRLCLCNPPRVERSTAGPMPAGRDAALNPPVPLGLPRSERAVPAPYRRRSAMCASTTDSSVCMGAETAVSSARWKRGSSKRRPSASCARPRRRISSREPSR